jgi:nucleoid-associated protein YgaU
MRWALVLLLATGAAVPGSTRGVDQLAGGLAQAALLVLLGWVGVLTSALLLGRLPTTAGILGRAMARRLLPVAAHTVLGVAVAASVTVPAHADAAPELLIDRLPTVATIAPAMPAAAPTAQPATATTAGGVHVVRPGDNLWRIAAATLPAQAAPGDVDRTWRAWWRTNRSVIGDDPNLIHVGQRLLPPPA